VYAYDSFGVPYVKSGSGSSTVYVLVSSYTGSIHENSRLYTAREYDRETHLYFLRARYYSPTTGKFISRDPIGQNDQINLYTYVKNNPFLYTDLFGKAAKQFVEAFDKYNALKKLVYDDDYYFWLSKDMQISLLTAFAESETKAKELHYARNKYNTGLPTDPYKAIVDGGWEEMPWSKNIYHNQGSETWNIKFVSSDWHKEVVYDKNGDIVTSDENLWTYNFFSPNTEEEKYLHWEYDVKPYHLWGNTPNDKTSAISRRTWI
jgi:RHS repeat-associated protein